MKSQQDTQMLNLHSSAIHIQHKVSLNQHRAWLYLLYKAMPTLKAHQKFEISLIELSEAIGCQQTNRKRLKSELKELMSTIIEWNIFNKDKEHIWEGSALLAGCRIEFNSGICTYSFSPQLVEHLSEPSMYAKLNLLVTKRFKSKYALAIYTLAMDYLFLERNSGIKNISLEDFRNYFGLKDNQYRKIGDFNRRIIRPAEREINQSSDMRITIKPIIDTKKKITGYQLNMSLKDEFLSLYLNRMKRVPEKLSQEQGRMDIQSEKLKSFLLNSGIILPIVYKKSQRLLNKDEFSNFQQIEEYLLFLTQKFKAILARGSFDNPPALFISFIESDTYLPEYFELQRRKTLQQHKYIQKREEERCSEIKSSYDRERRLALAQHLEVNFESYQKQIHQVFNSLSPTIQKMLTKISPHPSKDWLKHLSLNIELVNHCKAFDFNFPPIDEWVTSC